MKTNTFFKFSCQNSSLSGKLQQFLCDTLTSQKMQRIQSIAYKLLLQLIIYILIFSLLAVTMSFEAGDDPEKVVLLSYVFAIFDWYKKVCKSKCYSS